MSLLQTLRNTPWLARLALLWFALTLGTAVASPLVNPQQELIICTSAGMVKITLHADGSISTTPSSELSCPLCLVGSAAAPALATWQPAPAQTLARVQPGNAVVCLAAVSATLPPARGPPIAS